MKLLVVDDAVQICDGIRDGLPWGKNGIDEVLTAYDGLSALAEFDRVAPEIVITDIRMAGLDGLELSREILSRRPETRIILLSAYSEFEYARKALTMGVFAYELKPLRVASLLERVREAQASWRELAQKDSAVRQYEQYRRQEELQAILRGEKREEASRFFARHYALAEDTGYAVALWCSDDSTSCAERVRALMDKAQGVCLTSVGSAEATLIPCPASRLYQEKLLADLRMLMAAQAPGVSCGLSSAGPLSRVPELLSEAEEALTLRFYGGRGSMNRRQGKVVWRQEPVPLPESPPMDRDSREGDPWRAVEKWAREIFDRLRREDPPYAPERVRALTLALLRALNTQLRRYLDEDDREIAADIFDLEGKPVLPFLTDYEDALLSAYRLAWRRYFSAEGDALNNFAIRCRYYIEHHYQTNLRVQEMAAYFCITPNYFSHLFKKTMNVPFKQYLTNVRVEQARRLLEKGGMTASQVASQVGFVDYKYFHQVYRKVTGRAPTQPPEEKTREEKS